MRSHGVSNFPDPRSGGGFSINRLVGSSSETINGVTVSGPTFESAAKTCGLAGTLRGGPPLSDAQEQAFIDKADCIRSHGVPDFPDPFFGPGGRGVGITLPAGFNTESPAVRHAEKACASVGAVIPGAGIG
jgi:hypothetical protein